MNTHRERLFAAQRAEVQRQFAGLWDCLHVVPVSEEVLRRASRPFPTRVATLDAMHLATALLLCDGGVTDLAMATHDAALGRAAQVEGLTVLGL